MKKEDTKQRDTKQRRMVYDEVMKRCDHPTAEDIYKAVQSCDEHVSQGTVYRNLNVLSENEDIMHVKVPGADRYDSRLDNHYHIICLSCGRVIDAPIDYVPSYDEEVSANTGFRIIRHRTVFEGLCPECAKLQKKD